jgi:hypothetical protein
MQRSSTIGERGCRPLVTMCTYAQSGVGVERVGGSRGGKVRRWTDLPLQKSSIPLGTCANFADTPRENIPAPPNWKVTIWLVVTAMSPTPIELALLTSKSLLPYFPKRSVTTTTTHEDLQEVARSTMVNRIESKMAALICWVVLGLLQWNVVIFSHAWTCWCTSQLL